VINVVGDGTKLLLNISPFGRGQCRYICIVVSTTPAQVLLLCGGHQKVINVVGDGTELLLNNRKAMGARVGSSQGHVVSPSLHG
jgi:hypothetical protein